MSLSVSEPQPAPPCQRVRLTATPQVSRLGEVTTRVGGMRPGTQEVLLGLTVAAPATLVWGQSIGRGLESSAIILTLKVTTCAAPPPSQRLTSAFIKGSSCHCPHHSNGQQEPRDTARSKHRIGSCVGLLWPLRSIGMHLWLSCPGSLDPPLPKRKDKCVLHPFFWCPKHQPSGPKKDPDQGCWGGGWGAVFPGEPQFLWELYMRVRGGP